MIGKYCANIVVICFIDNKIPNKYTAAVFNPYLSPLSLNYDRFYLYKLPKEGMSKPPKEGEMYLLLEKGSEGWTEGKVAVNDTLGALGRTVGQLYSQEKVRFHQVSFSSATSSIQSLKV